VDDAHKLRRAPGECGSRAPRRGEVEVDDTWVGGEQAGLQGSRQLKDRRATLVLAAVEKRAHASGSSSHERDSRLQGQYDNPGTCPERCTWFHHLYPTASKASQVTLRPALNMALASSRSARSYAKVRSPKSAVPLADQAIGNLPGIPRRIRLSAQSPQDASCRIFRPFLVSEAANQPSMSRFAEETSTTTDCGLLKQPDN
jgi:hypothetical protein